MLRRGKRLPRRLRLRRVHQSALRGIAPYLRFCRIAEVATAGAQEREGLRRHNVGAAQQLVLPVYGRPYDLALVLELPHRWHEVLVRFAPPGLALQDPHHAVVLEVVPAAAPVADAELRGGVPLVPRHVVAVVLVVLAELVWALSMRVTTVLA